jgi:hypothetical protein
MFQYIHFSFNQLISQISFIRGKLTDSLELYLVHYIHLFQGPCWLHKFLQIQINTTMICQTLILLRKCFGVHASSTLSSMRSDWSYIFLQQLASDKFAYDGSYDYLI